MFTNIQKNANMSKEGIGLKKLKYIYNILGLNFRKKKISFKSKHQKRLNTITNKVTYTETLKIKIKRAISFYIKMRTYRGIRHLLKYPVRGQRTHTNAKTKKHLQNKATILKKETFIPIKKQKKGFI